jgi:hypothetical protein
MKQIINHYQHSVISDLQLFHQSQKNGMQLMEEITLKQKDYMQH